MASEEAVLYTVKERKKKYIDDLLHIKRISAKLIFRNRYYYGKEQNNELWGPKTVLCDNPAISGL